MCGSFDKSIYLTASQMRRIFDKLTELSEVTLKRIVYLHNYFSLLSFGARKVKRRIKTVIGMLQIRLVGCHARRLFTTKLKQLALLTVRHSERTP